VELIDSLINTAVFLAKTVPIIAFVFYLVSYSINKSIMEKIAKKIEPLLKKLNLNPITIASIATCFVSPTAAYSMLSQALKEREVDEKEVIAASFLNSFPSIFSHLYTFFIPFVIPILGWAGVIYSITRFAVAIAKSLIGYLMALKWKSGDIEEIKVERRSVEPLKATLDNLKRIVPIMFFTFFAVDVLSKYGVFSELKNVLGFITFVDPNVIAIATIEFVNVRTAVVFAAGLLETGMNVKWAVIGLLLGNVISFSTRSIKHSLPMHVSLFGKLGVKIVVLNAIVSFILDVIIIVLLTLFL